jgi:amidase
MEAPNRTFHGTSFTKRVCVRLTIADYTQFLAGREVLNGSVWGIPWQSFWTQTNPDDLSGLFAALDAIEAAGGIIINGINA